MKILIRLPNWLGDVVMSTALVNAVSQLYPDAKIDVIIKSELAEIARLIPGINNVFPFSKKAFAGLTGAFRFAKAFRKVNYSIYFNLPVSLSSMVMAFASGAEKKIGFREAGGLFLLTNAYSHPQQVHRVDEYLSLAENFAGKKITQKKVNLISTTTVHPEKKVIINLNSEAESRRMPVDKGIALLNLLAENFEHQFTLIGSKKDIPFINKLLANITHQSRFENLAGKTDLGQLTTLLFEAAVLLTTDSGPAHVANSVGTPVVAVFGAGDENNTSPYNKEKLTVLRAGKLSCEPCVKNTCLLYGVPKCMQLLDNAAILSALRLYLPHA